MEEMSPSVSNVIAEVFSLKDEKLFSTTKVAIAPLQDVIKSLEALGAEKSNILHAVNRGVVAGILSLQENSIHYPVVSN